MNGWLNNFHTFLSNARAATSPHMVRYWNSFAEQALENYLAGELEKAL